MVARRLGVVGEGEMGGRARRVRLEFATSAALAGPLCFSSAFLDCGLLLLSTEFCLSNVGDTQRTAARIRFYSASVGTITNSSLCCGCGAPKPRPRLRPEPSRHPR
jgi:hypothetical protein